MQRLSEFIKKHRDTAILAGLSCFLAGVTVAWLWLDNMPPAWDDAWYLANSLVMFDTLAGKGIFGYVHEFFRILGPKPPLITILPTPFFLLLGRDYHYAFVVNLLLVPLLFFCVYRLGKEFSTPRAGLLAVYILGTMPMVYGLARWYLADFALVVFVCLAVYFLTQSGNLQNRRNALALGIVCGLGSLLKAPFLLYVACPITYVIIRSFSEARQRQLPSNPSKVLATKTLYPFLLPAILLPLPWYLVNLPRTYRYVLTAGFSQEGDFYGTGHPFTVGAVKAYLVRLINAGPSCYYVGLGILMLAFIVLTKHPQSFLKSFSHKGLIFLSLWALPFLVFLFGRNKDVRYAAPLLPVYALALAFAIEFVISQVPRARNAIATLVLAFPLIALLQNSFGLLGGWQPRIGSFQFASTSLGYARKYDPALWHHAEIVETLAHLPSAKQGAKVAILLGTDRAGFNSNNLGLAAVQARLPLEISTTAYEMDRAAAVRLVDETPFFIYKDGGEPESTYFNRQRGAVQQEVRESGKFVEIPCGLALPDGGRVRIFKNLSQNSLVMSGALLAPGLDDIGSCDVNFDGKIRLAGLMVELKPSSIDLKYRWRCLKPVDRNYWCFTHILDEQNNVIGYLDHQVLGGEPPMPQWREGEVAVEHVRYLLQPRYPGSVRRLRIGLYDLPSGERLKVVGSSRAEGLELSLTDDGTAILVGFGSTAEKANAKKPRNNVR